MKVLKNICFIVALVLLLSTLPSAALAAEATEPYVVTKIDALSPSVLAQTLSIGSVQTPQLPKNISASLDNTEDAVVIPVTWKSAPSFDIHRAGNYFYKMSLPSQYRLSENVVLPIIKITVTKLSTSIAGVSKNIKKKSRSVLSDSISAAPAYGRTLFLQIYKNGKWVTKKKYTLNKSKSASLKVVYPKDWWTRPVSRWRIYLPESSQGRSAVSSIITINTAKYYQNPSKYIHIRNKITLKHSGAYNLNLGYMGLKVQKVNRHCKIGDRHWPRYTRQTKTKVKSFQKKKKLKATGVVNKKTWIKMGFSEKSWSTLGAYVAPIKVNPSSTKKDHIEAMIRTAKKYLGTDYVVGASGKPGQGADCSGLVIQALYSAGVDPYPVSCIRHSKPGYEFECRNLWANKKFKTIPYSKKKRGDLIFYKGRRGTTNHIAIYLGKGKVIESWPNKVVIWPIKNGHRSVIKGVKRVFN